MKILLDQGLPRSAVSLLSQLGIDCVHVLDIGLSRADDADILDKARLDNRIIVTFDADFHTLLALSGATSPSVIRIRIEGLLADALTKLIVQVLHVAPTDLTAGALVSVQHANIRVRRLPITP